MQTRKARQQCAGRKKASTGKHALPSSSAAPCFRAPQGSLEGGHSRAGCGCGRCDMHTCWSGSHTIRERTQLTSHSISRPFTVNAFSAPPPCIWRATRTHHPLRCDRSGVGLDAIIACAVASLHNEGPGAGGRAHEREAFRRPPARLLSPPAYLPMRSQKPVDKSKAHAWRGHTTLIDLSHSSMAPSSSAPP